MTYNRIPVHKQKLTNLCLFMFSVLFLICTAHMETEAAQNIVSLPDYEDYLADHSSVGRPLNEIVIEGGSYSTATGSIMTIPDFMGNSGITAVTPEEGAILWEFDIEQAGMYNILIEYYPITGKGGVIERELTLNGTIPFSGARYIEFYRVWKDRGAVTRDSRDNDIRPKQIEEPMWISEYVKDSVGFYKDAYLFYFQKGINTLELVSIKEPMAIRRIILTQQESLPAYQELAAEYQAKGYKAASAVPVKIQAENALYKSGSTLYAINDRSSPMTEPYHPSKVRLNAIGGSNWKSNGQWISWEFEVPESGLYEIALKYRQNIKTGATVTRTLKIDGQIPFAEARNLSFYYNNDWQAVTLGGDEPFMFYLEKGIHTLTLEVSLGDELADILRITENMIFELNRAYRQLLMIIGSSPDVYRDYQLNTKAPDSLRIINEQKEQTEHLSGLLTKHSKGKKGNESAALDRLMFQLSDMDRDHTTIAKRWGSFKDNLISVGTWSLNLKDQPLELDYIVIQPPGEKLERASANFFEKTMHELRSFAASFSEDYNTIGRIYEGEALEVWLLASASSLSGLSSDSSSESSGRDQAKIIKDLVDNEFIPATNIPVNVKLVSSGVLLSATLAGRGPDVALNVGRAEPVNYALRNAVTDLSGFPDFYEMTKSFHESALVAFRLGDGVYALPQTTTFPVLFYREDILEELGIKVPDTWDEFYNAMAIIQKRNMSVGVPADTADDILTSFSTQLFQRRGQLYEKSGATTGLRSETAINTFIDFTSLYTKYGSPVVYNFANRFRTGEMPMAIAEYTRYSFLSVFAPEIKGLWSFAPVPGTVREDGTIDRSVPVSGYAAIILNASTKKDNAWEFLKWWLGEETQTQYGNEVESVLGVAGRLPTSNIDALSRLPWSAKDLRQLTSQLEWAAGIQEAPGGYFTSRHLRNAFYSVYTSKEDPRETIEDYAKIIANEIYNKRKEFGLE